MASKCSESFSIFYQVQINLSADEIHWQRRQNLHLNITCIRIRRILYKYSHTNHFPLTYCTFSLAILNYKTPTFKYQLFYCVNIFIS